MIAAISNVIGESSSVPLASLRPELLWGGLIAEAAVGIGIILESWKPRSCKDIAAFVLIVGGVVFSAVCTLLLFSTDERISGAQQSKIIGLETRLAARKLNDDQAIDIADRMKDFWPLSFQVIPYWDDQESLDIGNRIARILESNGWKLENPTRWTSLAGVVAGVIVNVDSRASSGARQAAKELAKALTDNGVAAKEEEAADKTTNPPSERINISVGIKP